MEVSGYYFRNILKKTRRRFALQASEQALYEELIDICNQESWSTSFQVSNGELTTALNCNEKSLIKWRQSLINAGLISYNSGQSKRSFGIYTLATEETAVKNTVNQGADKGTNRTANQGTNPSDYNKTKVKKTKQSISHSGADAPQKKEKNLIWQVLVESWFIFYEKKFEVKPTFNGSAQKSLKEISRRLKKTHEDAGMVWDEDLARRSVIHFFNLGFLDPWLRQNFLLTNLASKYDVIVQPKKEFNATEKNRDSYAVGRVSPKDKL